MSPRAPGEKENLMDYFRDVRMSARQVSEEAEAVHEQMWRELFSTRREQVAASTPPAGQQRRRLHRGRGVDSEPA